MNMQSKVGTRRSRGKGLLAISKIDELGQSNSRLEQFFPGGQFRAGIFSGRVSFGVVSSS